MSLTLGFYGPIVGTYRSLEEAEEKIHDRYQQSISNFPADYTEQDVINDAHSRGIIVQREDGWAIQLPD